MSCQHTFGNLRPHTPLCPGFQHRLCAASLEHTRCALGYAGPRVPHGLWQVARLRSIVPTRAKRVTRCQPFKYSAPHVQEKDRGREGGAGAGGGGEGEEGLGAVQCVGCAGCAGNLRPALLLALVAWIPGDQRDRLPGGGVGGSICRWAAGGEVGRLHRHGHSRP